MPRCLKLLLRKILITQPRPESDKSPYFELARRHEVEMAFLPFIRLEGIPSKDFRRQKVEIGIYSAVIFTSRHAIDHFFRTAEEMKISYFAGYEVFLHYRSGGALSPEIYSLQKTKSFLWCRWYQ